MLPTLRNTYDNTWDIPLVVRLKIKICTLYTENATCFFLNNIQILYPRRFKKVAHLKWPNCNGKGIRIWKRTSEDWGWLHGITTSVTTWGICLWRSGGEPFSVWPWMALCCYDSSPQTSVNYCTQLLSLKHEYSKLNWRDGHWSLGFQQAIFCQKWSDIYPWFWSGDGLWETSSEWSKVKKSNRSLLRYMDKRWRQVHSV